MGLQLTTAEQRLARMFGEGVKRQRQARGYTQAKLAEMIGANRRAISELERGKGTSYLGLSLAAAEALGLDIASIFAPRCEGAARRLPPL
jgi:DNA-binding XRE family transcriptional regulator